MIALHITHERQHTGYCRAVGSAIICRSLEPRDRTPFIFGRNHVSARTHQSAKWLADPTALPRKKMAAVPARTDRATWGARSVDAEERLLRS